MRKQMILTSTFVHLQTSSHVSASSEESGARWLSFQSEPDTYHTSLHLFLPTNCDPADVERLADLFNEIIAKSPALNTKVA